MAEVIRINEDTWRMEDGFVRYYLLAGKESALLVDTGASSPDARDIAQGLTDLPLMLINTHADRDHIAGNGSFGEIYMSPNEEPHYRKSGGTGTVIPVKEGDVIDLGDRQLKIIDIPGHTKGSIAILDVNNRVLISGDTIQDGDIFMFGEEREMDKYIGSLKHMSDYDGMFDVIYPMHGSFPVYPDLIPKLLEGAEQIRAGKAEGQHVDMFGNDVILCKFPYAGFFVQ